MKQVNQNKASLSEVFPKGMVFSRKYLLEQGIASYTIDNYIRSEKLKLISKGIYIWKDYPLSLDGFLASLPKLWDKEVIVAARTAIEWQGLSHNISFNTEEQVTLLAQTNVPVWLKKLVSSIKDLNVELVYGGKLWDYQKLNDQSQVQLVRSSFSVSASSSERAILELLNQIPNTCSFEAADNIFQGMTQLSPRKMSQLLEACISVKTKRLFFWFANRHQYAWLKYLNRNDFDLGQGKRVIAIEGTLDKEFLITVPRDMQSGVDYG